MATRKKTTAGTAPAVTSQSGGVGASAQQSPPVTATEGAAKPVPSVVVTSLSQKGRWRIGRFFTPEPQMIALVDLTAEQQERLVADPQLVCQLIDAD